MLRYEGYFNMPDDDYSDVDATPVSAECENCHKVYKIQRESAWTDDSGKLWTDCMCSENT